MRDRNVSNNLMRRKVSRQLIRISSKLLDIIPWEESHSPFENALPPVVGICGDNVNLLTFVKRQLVFSFCFIIVESRY